MVSVKKLVVGYISTNCYIISSDKDNRAVIIDPGGSAGRIKNYLDENNLTPVAILLTHGHFDHILAVASLKRDYDLKVYIHKNDADMLTSDANLSKIVGLNIEKSEADNLLHGNEKLKFGEMVFDVIHTPGHSKGSVSYIFNEEIIFCGDTLFFESYGATHFAGGNIEELKNSIEKLFALPKDMALYCGHNKESTLDYERENNPIKYA